MSRFTYQQLVAACEAGGATAMSLVTELVPAGGAHTAIAPAHYTLGRDTATFAYETRLIDGEPAHIVIVDQKQAQLGRVEAAILQAIRDRHPLLSRVPRVQVAYDGGRAVFTDLELPQRVYDGHILAGTIEGRPVAGHPVYQAVRDCAPDNARTLLELSPGSLVFGAWDATRKTRQSRYRSALVGEIIGVLVDQQGAAPREAGTAGGRVDPVGPAVTLSGDELRSVLAAQRDQLDPQLVRDVEDAAGAGDTAGSGALLGLGDRAGRAPGVVSCSRIIRTQVLSFAALRGLRFDCGPAGDAACRALLAAYALAGLARSNAELNIRSNCDLIEAGPIQVRLDAREGEFVTVDAPTVDEADELLERALAEAGREADIHWRGQVLQVTGNPAIYAAAQAGPAALPRPAARTRLHRLTHFIESRKSGSRA